MTKNNRIPHTCHDGVEREFSSYTIPDMRRLAPKLMRLSPEDIWLAFIFAGARAPEQNADAMPDDNDQYLALIDFIEPLFTEKYCSHPLTRDQIENEDHIDTPDLRVLINIAIGNHTEQAKPADE